LIGTLEFNELGMFEKHSAESYSCAQCFFQLIVIVTCILTSCSGPNRTYILNSSFKLEDMRSNNIIENITIKLGAIVKMDEGCKLGDDWDRLDKVLMRSGWFALKRVSLIIEVYVYTRSPKKLPEEVAVQIASDAISTTFKKQVYFVQIRLTLG
jgi:hypothetical protein